MPEAYADTSVDWVEAIRQRRKALLQRLGMGSASALVFGPVVGWEFAALWVIGYFLIQLLDLWVFEPINSGRMTRLNGFHLVAGGGVLFLNAAYFGSLSVALWLMGGVMGGVCAGMLLTAGAIYSVINSPRSKVVLGLTIAPHLMYLVATPFFMASYGASVAFTTAATVSVGVFATYCFSTWQRMNAARTAETQARIEANTKCIEAERIMAGREAFLSAIGHDLRTPISAILTGASELERGAVDGNGRSQARLIIDAGVMMQALLDDLLDHAKLNAGHMTVEISDFNLRALLSQTVLLWRGSARAKGLKLRIEGAATMPTMVRGDPMRLRQVLNNLISNAMKFTDEGAITLKFSGWDDEVSSHALLIEVSDTGPGMTREQVRRLFTPFDQISTGIVSRHGGTGLGLAISRQLAELMGGQLTARSAPGQGAKFTLSLNLGASTVKPTPTIMLDLDSREVVARTLRPQPVPARVAAPAPEPAPEPAPAPEPSSESIVTLEPQDVPEDGEDRPLRVLVVDDHDINRRAIQLILQPLGCETATAADGLVALKICEASAFDIIFMDIRMPELDGRETTRRLRSGNGPNAGTPVIAVTADTSPDDIAACMAAGMDYFVPKPITPALLLNAISQTLAAAAAQSDTDSGKMVDVA
ncbi:ATP-binding protein [uncultured Brevundimonas sp.]|uniref:ATP-binding protein n=1 Tax=uncultured Brevundimonas sp. TaxID=213418 RepID=UPI0030EF7B0E|tara:strand:- start:61103 stop:63043 length:1941 start_codon:yes stop_codon:yes gene_type:complete